MCFQYYNQFRYEGCGHIENYAGDTVMCSYGMSMGSECSSVSKSYGSPIDTSGKCYMCP
jgi:hypothetical protein